MTRTQLALLAATLYGLLVATFNIVNPRPIPSVPEITPTSGDKSNSSLRKPLPVGYPTFVSPHANPIAISGNHIFVTNTPASTVDVIDRESKKLKQRIHVGIDPVSIAVRPDGKEVWAANHISDSVSVIDNNPSSPTYLNVIATIQEFDNNTRATTFDEPVGIAFAGNEKAYVALSSENQIAVIDVESRKITKRLKIPAQDPRSIAIRNGHLYVIPFESNNKTQLSGGNKENIDGERVTFDAWEHSINNNNVLSLGHVVDIVSHPDIPDRDLFIFDTTTDELVSTVESLGTLLYGVTVGSQGEIFIAQTDARNTANGRAGTKKHGMQQLENRAFLNQITKVTFRDGTVREPIRIELEPLPPKHPDKETALATPYAIQISSDDSTLVVTAAGSDKLFTVDVATGQVLGRVAVGVVPRGIAIESSEDGKLSRAWVYNAVADTVSVVDLSNPSRPTIEGFVKLEDPTHKQVKLGRTWFNAAAVSSTGTFSCESCHPDCNTDQLLWVLKTPIVTGGDQIMPRSTMPVRGLRDTAPFHWDGVLGDPYGGSNSTSINRAVDPVADPQDQTTSTRHLVDVSLAEILKEHSDNRVNDEGKPGGFTAAERDDLALFLLSVPFPPAQRRAYDNVLSKTAQEGFKLFHIEGDYDPKQIRPNVCGDCHRMPFFVSTNTLGSGMDAPTWRGAYDRFLILPQGRINIIDFPFYREVTEKGQSEEEIWRFSWGGRPRMNPVWRMVVEGSTGFSGAFARQVTLNKSTANDQLTNDLMQALQIAAAEGGVVLEAEGVLINGGQATAIEMQYDPGFQTGVFVSKARDRKILTWDELIAMAEQGKFVGTFTGRHGENATVDTPQPALWTLGNIYEQRGRQQFPIIHNGDHSIVLSGRNFSDESTIYIDGRRVPGSIEVVDDEREQVRINLPELPAIGMHFLQVQSPGGMFSNDIIFHVTSDNAAAINLQRLLDAPHVGETDPLLRAVAQGNLDETKKLLGDGSRINDRYGDGATLLSTAALYNQLDVTEFLLSHGAKVNATNKDGNTPLHVAAFMCRKEIALLLLNNGASLRHRNNNRETPLNTVSGQWSFELGEFYRIIASSTGIRISLTDVRQARSEMANLLQRHDTDSK